MTNGGKSHLDQIDIAILGEGPAGLQAALVLSRTRKKIIVFDDPDIPGFVECWADTIIPCPFCDGYENRDRIWSIVVNSKIELDCSPKMAQYAILVTKYQ
jgi:flavin-dependent dehydrogenase